MSCVSLTDMTESCEGTQKEEAVGDTDGSRAWTPLHSIWPQVRLRTEKMSWVFCFLTCADTIMLNEHLEEPVLLDTMYKTEPPPHHPRIHIHHLQNFLLHRERHASQKHRLVIFFPVFSHACFLCLRWVSLHAGPGQAVISWWLREVYSTCCWRTRKTGIEGLVLNNT